MLIGEILVIASGLFLGYIFPELLTNYGLKEKESYNYLSILGLAVIPIVAYATRSIWISGKIGFSGIEGFTSSIFPWISITILIGGAVRLIQKKIH